MGAIAGETQGEKTPTKQSKVIQNRTWGKDGRTFVRETAHSGCKLQTVHAELRENKILSKTISGNKESDDITIDTVERRKRQYKVKLVERQMLDGQKTDIKYSKLVRGLPCQHPVSHTWHHLPTPVTYKETQTTLPYNLV